MIIRFQRNISLLGRSQRTFENYSRHVAKLTLHFQCLPTALNPEQVQDYLYELQLQSQTPSQTYFKHTVFGLRFLLKSEGLPYDFLKLPAIPKVKKLPVVLSKLEMYRMLQAPKLLKHKLLLGILYGCGLRCQEVAQLKLKHIDMDRAQIHVVQSKGNKDRIVPLSKHLIRGIQNYIHIEQPKEFLFESNNPKQAPFVQNPLNPYSSRGIQWVVKQAAKTCGILKDVHTHTLRHTFACHLLEDGLNIVSLQQLLGHSNIETTMEYLKIAQLEDRVVFSPLDTLFAQCGPSKK